MKVSKLIELLQKCPQDLEVRLSADEECGGVMHYTYPELETFIRLLTPHLTEVIKSYCKTELFTRAHRIIE